MKIRSALMAAVLAGNSGSVPRLATEYSMSVDCERSPAAHEIVGLEELSSVLGDPDPYEERFSVALADRGTNRIVGVRVSSLGAISINGRLLTDNDAGVTLLTVGDEAALIGGIPATHSSTVYESPSTAATLACVGTD